MHVKNQWFRIAGIAKRLRSNTPPPYWRFEVAGDSTQHMVHSFSFRGELSSDNPQPGVNVHAQEDELIAWVACFGDARVDDHGVAAFTLREPPQPPPW